MHGFLLLEKKSGHTSFESLTAVKRAFGTGKAGHTGTLDKFASGLLLVLVGRGVKLASLFLNCIKEYSGVIRFGEETDTLDPEGTVIANGPVPSREKVEEALAAFRGNILQSPPQYSALHINGRRAHELAREGKTIIMEKRPVTVYDLKLVSWNPPDAEIHARVSSGTYIRSLARDIALEAESRAHLSALRRTAVGDFRLENAASDTGEKTNLINALRPLDEFLFQALSIPCLHIGTAEAESFIHGKPIESIFTGKELDMRGTTAAAVFLKSMPGALLGVLERRNDKWGYMHVFAGI